MRLTKSPTFSETQEGCCRSGTGKPSVKGQLMNITDFVNSVIWWLLSMDYWSLKAVIDSMTMLETDYVLITLFGFGPWATVCHPFPDGL